MNAAAPLEGVEFHFDETSAHNAVAFFPRYLRLTAGEWAGRPFHLAPWQADRIIRPLFGWRRPDGRRRYKRCYVWVPRKNGKTELAAGIAVLLTVADGEPGGQVFSIATDKLQASIVFDKAVAMVAYSAELQEHLTTFKTSIFCPELGSAFRPLSGIPKGKHGLNMSGLVGDEIHEWDDDRLYQFVHQSSAARREPLEFLISTAGEKTGYGWEAWQYCQGILDGTIDDPETLVVMIGADAEKDKADPDYWKRESTWAEANPNFPTTPKPEYLRAEAKAAMRLPRLENDFKRYHLNLPVEQTTRWLPMDAWADCGAPAILRPYFRAVVEAAEEERAPPERPPEYLAWLAAPPAVRQRWRELPSLMAGKRAFGGVDLSSTTDLTCLAWFFEAQDGGLPTVVPRFYVPRDTMQKRIKTDKVPYDLWERMGALTVTPGNVVDYEFIKRDLYADAELYRVGSVAFDRWNATQIILQVVGEGLDAKPFGQGFQSMTGPAKELEKLLLGRTLDHGGHPVLSWCARNAACEKDAAENIKPSKKKSNERIDGIVAAVMALGASMEAEPEQDLSGFLANPVIA